MPRRAPTPPDESRALDLASRARRLHKLAREREQSYETSTLAQGLETRQAEFKSAVDRADALRRARELLTTSGVAVPVNSQEFVRLAGHLKNVQDHFANDPGSLIQPGAYEATDINRALDVVEQSLLQAWQRHVRAAGHTRLVAVFEHFARYDVAQQLRNIGTELERLSAVLPRRVENVQRVSELQTAGLQAIRSSQLGEDLDFLEEAMGQGVPLSTLLDDSERIDRLRQRGIIDILRVIAS